MGAMVASVLTGCGSSDHPSADAGPSQSPLTLSPPVSPTPSPSRSKKAKPKPFRQGNPDGHAAIPAAARAVDTSHPAQGHAQRWW